MSSQSCTNDRTPTALDHVDVMLTDAQLLREFFALLEVEFRESHVISMIVRLE